MLPAHVLMLTIFRHLEIQTFLSVLLHKKACQTISFCLRIMKNCQRQYKGKPHKYTGRLSGSLQFTELQLHILCELMKLRLYVHGEPGGLHV
jgi:hypothetical protein